MPHPFQRDQRFDRDHKQIEQNQPDEELAKTEFRSGRFRHECSASRKKQPQSARHEKERDVRQAPPRLSRSCQAAGDQTESRRDRESSQSSGLSHQPGRQSQNQPEENPKPENSQSITKRVA